MKPLILARCLLVLSVAVLGRDVMAQVQLTPQTLDAILAKLPTDRRKATIAGYWQQDVIEAAKSGNSYRCQVVAAVVPVIRKYDPEFNVHYKAAIQAINKIIADAGWCCGLPPGMAMLWELEAKARYDSTQVPQGVFGLRPVGRTSDGRPVFDEMPVYDEVPEAFVATVCFPSRDPYLPSPPIRVEVPAKGLARDAFKKKIASDFNMCYYNRIMYMGSDERRSEECKAEVERLKSEQKMKEASNREHEYRLSHMVNMTRDQYLKARELNLKRIENGSQHTDMFRDENGNIWKVDGDGNAYRYNSH